MVWGTTQFAIKPRVFPMAGTPLDTSEYVAQNGQTAERISIQGPLPFRACLGPAKSAARIGRSRGARCQTRQLPDRAPSPIPTAGTLQITVDPDNSRPILAPAAVLFAINPFFPRPANA